MGVALWRNMGVVVVIISWSLCQTKGRKPTNRLTAYNYNCWPISEVSWGDPSRTERSRPKTVWPMQWINYSLCHVQSLSTLGASSPVQRFGPKITSYTHLTPEKISLNELGLWTICHGFFFSDLFSCPAALATKIAVCTNLIFGSCAVCSICCTELKGQRRRLDALFILYRAWDECGSISWQKNPPLQLLIKGFFAFNLKIRDIRWDLTKIETKRNSED